MELPKSGRMEAAGRRAKGPPRPVVIGVAFGLAAAGLLGGWIVISSRLAAPPAVVDDGPSLYTAYAATNLSVQNTSGGPWALFWGIGIAAQAPFSPNVLGYFSSENVTVNNCGEKYQGLTIWNGTIPVFNGTLDSGTAPFWQFAFYSGTSDQILFATDVSGEITVYPSEPNADTADNCMPWAHVGLGPPNPVNWTRDLYATSANSPAVAEAAMTLLGPSSFETLSPWTEIFYLGPGMLDINLGVGASVAAYFDRCGLEGVAGIQPLESVYTNLSGGNPELLSGSNNCAVLNGPNSLNATEGYYQFGFSSPTDRLGGGTLQVTIPYLTEIRPYNSSEVGPDNSSLVDTDAWGLANWMTSWNLSSPMGLNLPMGAPACGGWVASLAQCPANATGWFVVVTAPDGSWINSYGVAPDGRAGWSQPVTAMVSHQRLVIVVPGSWYITGDELSVTSTVLASTVTGWAFL